MKTYADYLKSFFPGFKVQKLSLNAGFTCPNRDGSLGYGGCIYCRNDSFTPSYCNPEDSIRNQLEKGKIFFSRKYPGMKYLAYFQSYTNTYNSNLSKLEKLYLEALSVEDIVGLVIGTRPDTISSELFSLLGEINKDKHVFLEIGAETSNDNTLKLINRNHTWNDVVNATETAYKNGLHPGLHLIAGLPGENSNQILENVRKACQLPIETLKIHQLQILYGTPLFHQLMEKKISVRPFNVDDYLDLCVKIVRVVPENIVIERFLAQSPPEMVYSPKWGLKNYEFMHKLSQLI